MSKYLVSLTNGDTVKVDASSYSYDEAFHVFEQDGETKLVVPSREVSYVGRKEDEPTETYCSKGLCPNGPGCKWDAKQAFEIRVSAGPGDVSADVLKALGVELGKVGGLAGPEDFPSAAVAAVSDIIREVDYPSYSRDAEIAGRVLRAASPHLSAQAWDEGFSAACEQFRLQDENPRHPITRTNPYERLQEK